MTHHRQTTALDEIGQLLAEQGFDGLADALRVLLNEVMKLERAAVLGAGPYQRAEGRTGYANGFKPKTVQTRVGALTLAVPRLGASSSTPRPWRRAALARSPQAGRRRDVRPGRLDPQGRRHHREAPRAGGHLRPGQPGGPGVDAELEKWRCRPPARPPT